MTDAALVGPVAAPELHVMTFNIRRRVSKLRSDSPDRWAARKALVQRILAAEQPTLLGVQEALTDQVHFVAEALGPRYRWIGRGRDPSGDGEHCPIFYDSRRLELTEWKQYALSETPEHHGSRSWGNLTRRVVVSATLTDVATGARLFAVNTHLDHISRRSRLESVRFILNLAADARADKPEITTIVTGDFNADQGSAVYRRLTAEDALEDTWSAAREQLTPQWGTFSNYRGRRPGGKRIDLILVEHGVEVVSAGINATRFDSRAASDHEPVQAVLRLTAPARPDTVMP